MSKLWVYLSQFSKINSKKPFVKSQIRLVSELLIEILSPAIVLAVKVVQQLNLGILYIDIYI